MADTVTGTVLDDTGEPLIGATVGLKGNPSVVTATNFDGVFTLKVPDLKTAVLNVTYIGYTPEEVAVRGHEKVTITMKSATTALEEVVVVGYGQ